MHYDFVDLERTKKPKERGRTRGSDISKVINPGSH